MWYNSRVKKIRIPLGTPEISASDRLEDDV